MKKRVTYRNVLQASILAVLMLLTSVSLLGQTTITNKGVEITNNGVDIYLNGDYRQENHSLNANLSGGIINAGTLHLTGSLFNNTSNHVFLTQSGSVRFYGTLAQTINGDSSIHFFNVLLQKPNENLILNQDLWVFGDLNFGTGHVLTNNHRVRLGFDGELVNESNSSFVGDLGEVTLSRFLNSPSDATNLGGTGIYLGSGQNLGTTHIRRYNEVQPAVTNGSIQRHFEINPAFNSQMQSAKMGYLAPFLNGQTADSLGVWISTNGGLEWLDFSSSANTSAQLVSGTASRDLSATSLITLAERECHSLPQLTLPTSLNRCGGDALVLDPQATDVKYLWSTGATTPTITVNSGGTYGVTVTDLSGCTNYAQVNVIDRAKPVAAFSAENRCFGEVVNLTNNSSISSGSIALTRWDYGDNAIENDTSLAVNGAFNYAQTGVYYTSLVVVSDFGCRDTADNQVFVFPNPEADFTADDICLSETATFSNNSSIAYGGMLYTWEFGDGNTATSSNPTNNYSNSGDYTVKLIATSNAGCKDSVEKSIAVHEIPTASFTATANCNNDPLIIANTSSISSGGISYLWDFGDATTDTLFQPTKTYNNGGVYTVELSAFNTLERCSTKQSQQVTVETAPLVNFVVSDVCEGDTLQFNNLTTSPFAANFTWFLNDSVTSSDSLWSYFQTAPDSFSVMLKAQTANGCADSLQKTVSINPRPTADFSFDLACVSTDVGLQNLSSIEYDSVLYQWDFGDGTQSTAVVPNKSYNFPLTYQIELTASTAFGCSDSISKTLAIRQNPSVTVPDSIGICGSQYVFEASNTNYDYAWSTGDTTDTITLTTNGRFSFVAFDTLGCSSRDSFSLHLFPFQTLNLGADTTVCDTYRLEPSNVSGNFLWNTGSQSENLLVNTTGSYFLALTDSNFCTVSDTILVTVSNTPNLQLGNDLVSCSGDTLLLDGTTSGATQYSWNTGETQSVIQIFEDTTYVLTVSNVEQCSATDSVRFTLLDKPAVDFSSSLACAGESVTFTSTAPELYPPLSYTWRSSEFSSPITSSSFTRSFADTGKISVTLEITNANGCTDSITKIISINEQPSASFVANSVCLGDTIQVQNTSATLASNASYQWFFNNSLIDSSNTLELALDSAQAFTLLLSIETDSGCIDNFSQALSVFGLPELALIDSVTACADSIILNATASENGSFLWDDGSSFSDRTVFSSGTYTLNFTNQNNCSSQKSSYVTLFNPPQLNLGADTSNCGPILVQAAAGFTNYTWNTGDTSASIDIAQSGNYGLTVTDANGCQATDELNAQISSFPVVTLPTSDTLCEGESVFANAGSAANTYIWNDGLTNRIRTFTQAGNYSVTATNAAGCQTTDSFKLLFKAAPNADFQFSGICQNDSTLFSNLSTIDSGSFSIRWIFPNNVIVLDSLNPAFVFSTTGTKSVKLVTESDFGCADSVTKSVNIRPSPIADFEAQDVCHGAAVTFINNSGISSGSISSAWNLGDGTTRNQASFTKTYSDTGSYTVRLTVASDFGCTDDTIQTVRVFPNPIIPFGNQVSTCGDSLVLDAGSVANQQYNWSSGDSLSTATFTNAGQYSLTVLNQFGCSAQRSFAVDLNSILQPNLGPDTSVCGNFTLMANVQGSRYNWNTGESSSSLEVDSTGFYWVEVTDNNGCVGSDSISIIVNPEISVDLGPDIIRCANEEVVEIGANISAANYSWSTASADSSISITQSGTYALSVENVFGCTAEDSVFVQLNPAPVANFLVDSVCADEDLVFFSQATNTGQQIDYAWTINDAVQSTDSSFTFSTQQFGNYNVKLSLTNQYGCQDSVSQIALIYPKPQTDFSFGLLCENQAALFSNQSQIDTGSLSFTWYSDSVLSTSADYTIDSISGNFSQLGLVATSVQGCSDSAAYNLVVEQPQFANLPDTVDSCANAISLEAAVGAASYAWSTNSQSRVVNVSTDGTYTVTVTSQAGCITQDSVFVNLRLPVSLNLPHTLTACDSLVVGQNVVNASQYTWSTFDTTAQIGVSQTGNYSLVVSSADGCIATDSVSVTINNSPIFSLGADTGFCPGSNYFLQTGLNGMTYNWSTGSTNPFELVSAAGGYAVTVTSPQGCQFSDTINLQHYAQPTASFTVVGTCQRDSFIFVNTSSIPQGIMEYDWSFGDGTLDTASNPTHLYQNAGTYQVFLQATSDFGCFATSSQSVVVRPNPNAVFSASNACEGSNLALTNNSSVPSGNLSYAWDFGDGTTANGNIPTKSYATAGSYVIQLVASSNFGCTDTNLVSTTIFGLPQLNLPPSVSTCDSTYTLDAQNPGSSYLWSNVVTTQQNTISQTGTYTVTVTNSNGCVATDTSVVSFDNLYNPVLPSLVSNCDSVSFDAGNSNFSLQWSNGISTASQTVTQSGWYVLTVTDANNCISTDSIFAQVNQSPQPQLGADTSFCFGDTLLLNAGAGSNYLWNTSSTQQQLGVTNTGAFFVTVTDSSGCFGTDNINVTVFQLPVFSLGNDSSICDSVELQINTNAVSYQWNTGSTAQQIVANTTGQYWALATNANNCSFSDTIFITRRNSAPFDLGADTTFCADTSLLLDAILDSATYLWNNGLTNSTLSVQESGVYSLRRTLVNGCINRDTIEVEVLPLPVLDFEDEVILCVGQTYTLSANDFTASYQWYGDTSGTPFLTGSGNNSLLVSDSGFYWVEVTDTNGCFNSDSSHIFISDGFIQARFLASSEAEIGDTIQFISLATPQSFAHNWWFDDGVTSTLLDPTHTYFLLDTFDVELTVGSATCSDSITKPIVIKPAQRSAPFTIEKPSFSGFKSLKVYPNPSTYQSTLEIELAEENQVFLEIYNINGALLNQVQLNGLEIIHSITTDKWVPGVYILKLRVNNQQETLRLLKL